MIFNYLSLIPTLLNLVSCNFRLLVVHNNDIHGRFEELRCGRSKCAGVPRHTTLIKKYRNEAKSGGPEVLFLNGGDTFQGSIWYVIWGWEICADFLNLMNPDVQCLGNHEFDKGLEILEKFVTACKFPTIGGNVDFSKYPSLVEKIPRSIVITKGNTKIGIMGYVTSETNFTSKPGVATFEDEIKALTKESNRLHKNGIRIIIALGHSGDQVDREIAKKVPHIDIVVGSHSHYLYWNGDIGTKGPGGEKIMGKYPKLIKRKRKDTLNNMFVPIVTAYAYSYYLGKIELLFDDNGKLLSWKGDPVYLTLDSASNDKDGENLLNKYRPKVQEAKEKRIGSLKMNLICHNRRCRNDECNCANLILDAFVIYRAVTNKRKVMWTDAPIAIMNAGSIMKKDNYTQNNIYRGDILEMLPNGNQLVIIKLKGKYLKQALEHGVSANPEDKSHRGEFLQVSGVKYIVDASKRKYKRVLSVKVRCGICNEPNYENLVFSRDYNIITTDFMLQGGDGHKVIKKFAKVVEYLDKCDEEVVSWYIQMRDPLFVEKGERIIIFPAIPKSSSNLSKPKNLLNYFLVSCFLLCNI